MIATSYVLGMRWPFGGVACKLIHSIPQATLAISMFSLLGEYILYYIIYYTINTILHNTYYTI